MIYLIKTFYIFLMVISTGIQSDPGQSTKKSKEDIMKDLKLELSKIKPSGEDYFDRANYYKKLGDGGSDKSIPALRVFMEEESEPWAKSYALAALVKLGDIESQKNILFKFEKKINVEDVDEFMELIQYIGKKKLALGFLSWLSNEKVVNTLGHRQNAMPVRFCDYAVWNAHLLGVKVAPKPTHLTNFDKIVRDKLSLKLRTLK